MSGLRIGSTVSHEAYGQGVVVEESPGYFKVYFHDMDRSKQIERESNELELIEVGEGTSMSLEDVEDAIWRVLTRYGGYTEEVKLGDRWTGGKVILQPADESMTPKEIPADTFFHKIVMVRDKLRVLEQQINSHKKLEPEDRVHLQQYITKAYGSMTTFNVLFKYKEDQFRGSSTK